MTLTRGESSSGFCVFSFALDRDGGANGAVSREARNRVGCETKRILGANLKHKLSEENGRHCLTTHGVPYAKEGTRVLQKQY